MARLAAITGATGFVGRYIVSALASRGWNVRILARRPPDHAQLAHLKIEVVLGDLADRGALRKLVDGADTVIHAAGLIKARTTTAFRTVNVDGTANLASAIRQRRDIRRVLLVSSIAAREPQLSAYARTKRMAEEMLATTLDTLTEWAVVRPCAIYGPWDRETLGIFRAVSLGIALRPRVANARIALIHAADVAGAIVTLCDRGPAGTTFELTDERTEGYSWDEILAVAESALNVRTTALRVPGAVLRGAAALNVAAAWVLRRTPMLTPGKAREILHADWGSAVARQPGRDLWQPAIGLHQGFTETARWYRDQHWLPSTNPLWAPRGTLQ